MHPSLLRSRGDLGEAPTAAADLSSGRGGRFGDVATAVFYAGLTLAACQAPLPALAPERGVAHRRQGRSPEEPSRPSPVDVSEQVGWRNVQRTSEPDDVKEANVPLTSLHTSDVRAVEARGVSQRFLGNPRAL